MEIAGIGTQVMECPRVRKLIDRHGETFLAQVYTPCELRYCNGKAQTTAKKKRSGRFHSCRRK